MCFQQSIMILDGAVDAPVSESTHITKHLSFPPDHDGNISKEVAFPS
jgi:hypothetical protein